VDLLGAATVGNWSAGDRRAKTTYDIFVSCNPGLTLVAVISAVVFVFSPAARADSGSPSYNQGKQAIDDQVLRRHVQLTPSDDLHEYCQSLLGNVTKSGMMPRVDSPPDFVAGCQDEGRALLASQ
jgi:hypothetical protein